MRPLRSAFWFSSVSKLLELENDKNVLNALSASTCLLTIGITSEINDIEVMVDFVDRVKIQSKNLVILVSEMMIAESTILQNKTINFDVRFLVTDRGNLFCYLPC